MRPTKTVLGAGLVALVISASAGAGGRYGDGAYYDYARVVAVDPIVRTVDVPTRRRVCWDEEVVRSRGHSHTPTIIGGIVGGVVGNRFGSGRGRDVATVAGALLGASVGHDIGRRHGGRHAYVDTERQCRYAEEYHQEERVDGYRVTYRYHGKHLVTQTDRHPGRRIRVRVAVTPAQ